MNPAIERMVKVNNSMSGNVQKWTTLNYNFTKMEENKAELHVLIVAFQLRTSGD